MLPSRFAYHRAASLEEALALFDQYGEDAKVLAGGQSLIPMMKLRFANPEHLIDVNHVEGLDAIDRARREPADRRAGAPPRAHDLRRHREVPHHRAGRAPDRRPAGAQPRHDRRLALPRGPGRRPRLRDAGAGRQRGAQQHRAASARCPSTNSSSTPSPPRSSRTSSSRRSACPRRRPRIGRRLPEARAQGGRLGHRRRRRGALRSSNGSIGRGGIGLTGVGLKNLEATRRRGVARRRRARATTRSPRPGGSPPRRRTP